MFSNVALNDLLKTFGTHKLAYCIYIYWAYTINLLESSLICHKHTI